MFEGTWRDCWQDWPCFSVLSYHFSIMFYLYCSDRSVTLPSESHSNKALYRGHLRFLHFGDPVINHFGHGMLDSCRWCHWRRWPASDFPSRNQKMYEHMFQKRWIPQSNNERTMNINKHQWTSMNINDEHPWASMNINEHPWTSWFFSWKWGFSIAMLGVKSDIEWPTFTDPGSSQL